MASKTEIQIIVEQARTERGNGKPLPYRDFADQLAAGLEGIEITHASVAYWESGERQPSIELLMKIHSLTSPDDWRHTFAAKLAAAKFADVLKPLGVQ